MTKKILLIIAITAGTCFCTEAQVANHALQLTPHGYVDCGPSDAMNGMASYTVQFWVNPDSWTSGATIFSRGDSFSATLGAEGQINFQAGTTAIAASSASLLPGRWSQITLVCDNGASTVYVNGTESGQGALNAISNSSAPIMIGGGTYSGRVDELRIWNIALPEDYDRFTFNTINEWCPTWNNLLVYYKMDMVDCDNLVDYKALGNQDQGFNNHGIFSDEGATRTKVTDNDRMPYLINGAYTANERFYDREIGRDQYLLSNDLIILGIQSHSDGHLWLCTPNNHGTIEGGEYLAEFEGRTGVLSLDGTGKMTCPERTLEWNVRNGIVGNYNGYTFESWLYLDEWTEGAYLIRKETNDGAKGFSLRLGTEGQLIARCNGFNYVCKASLTTGTWNHVAVVPRNTGVTRTTYLFVINGAGKSATASLSDGGTECIPADEVAQLPTYIGENIKGKLDDTALWSQAFDASAIKSQMTSLPMPGIGRKVDSGTMQRANAFYRYDDPAWLGYSSYSQDEWKRIMESAYDGYKGYVVRISVKSHNGWQQTIADAERRKIFAADLAKLSEGYHGVELDLEWMDGTQTTLGQLAQEIRAALPADRTFFISCHAYGAYRFPHSDMQYVDGFTFQQYGPQRTFFDWDNFSSSTQAFINYGFAKDKIMTSYATTTSNGYKGSEQVAVSGVRNGFLDGDYVPSTGNIDSGTLANGFTYYFIGPDQTYRRARYTMDNNLQGIFYWDMGNDVPVDNKYNLARWCSYGLNANVDRDIKTVNVNHGSAAGISDISSGSTEAYITVSPSPVTSTAKVYLSTGDLITSVIMHNLSGAVVMTVSGDDCSTVDASPLSPGIYLLTATTHTGAKYLTKLIKH